MIEVISLFILAFIWIVFAVVQDLRTREIANWLNFSLIAFALGFRFFYSLFYADSFGFFYQGLIGLGIFFVLGNLLYYGKMFAGGDAKLLIALGAVLPFFAGFYDNLEIFLYFFVIFLFAGAVYSLISSLRLCIKNHGKFKKEFAGQIKTNKKMLVFSLLFSIFLSVLSFLSFYLIFVAVLLFVFPYLYFYAKSVDETSMIKSVDSKKLREGDWLYKDVAIGKKTIKASWSGLKKEEIAILRKSRKKVMIREGIPFTPVFLITFLVLFYLWINGLDGFWF